MDQYHLGETIDYANHMINSTHHLMNQQHLQSHQTNQQPQYTQLHPSNTHRNLNNTVMNNNQVQMINGQKTNGNTSHNGQMNGQMNGNHSNGHAGGNQNGSNHNNHNSNNHSINGNHNSNHVNGTGNNIGPNTAIVHPTNMHHTNAHLNQQLMQLGAAASSPPQHQNPTIQHAQMSHDHLHTLETNSQLTNLTNSSTNSQQSEAKYTPPQSMKRKLDDYLEPQMTNDGLLNEDESPMKKLAQTNGNSSHNGKKTKGRVKIKMEFIDNKLRRYTTFSKRKTGIMKKAYELSTLTGTQVMLLVASETGHVYTFATKKLQPMITSEAGKALIQTCLHSPEAPNNLLDQQRMSATGFEETDLSYSIHDDSSEKDEDSSSSETCLQTEESQYKLEELKEGKILANFEASRILKQIGELSSTSTGRQQRKSKPTKALQIQLDNFQGKKARSQTNCISSNNQLDSPQSSSSSTSNSPIASPSGHLFTHTNNSSLGNLTNSVNSSSMNSTNRNSISGNLINEIGSSKQTNSDHLNLANNPNQSSFDSITLIQAFDNYKNSNILSRSTASSLPALNQNLITSPVINKQFNFKTTKQSNQQTAQLSTLINNTTGNLLFYPSNNTPTFYQASQGVVCASNNQSNAFNESLLQNFDNSQFNQSNVSNFTVTNNNSSVQFSNERKSTKKMKLRKN